MHPPPRLPARSPTGARRRAGLCRPGRGGQDHPRRRRQGSRLRPGHRVPVLPRPPGPDARPSSSVRSGHSPTRVIGAADRTETLGDAIAAVILTVRRRPSTRTRRSHSSLEHEPELVAPQLSFDRGSAVIRERGHRRCAGLLPLPPGRARRPPRRVGGAHHAVVPLQPARPGPPRRSRVRARARRRLRASRRHARRQRIRICFHW